LLVEFSPFLDEVASLAYCQEHRYFRLSLGEMLWLFIITLNEVGLSS